MDSVVNAGEVGRLINLMPVGIKEAALDSPTARASVQHFFEQVELFEKWLEDYHKSTNRLLAESVTLEAILANFTSHALMPQLITETMMDHDYSVLAIKKYHEGAKDFWMSMVTVVKRLNQIVCEPIRQFQVNDIKSFKEARKAVESTQKAYDTMQGKYAAQAKTTEPSSLREDAFQLHEARTRYLKAMMDYFTLAPQLRFGIDKLVTRIFYEQWREMKQSRDNTSQTFQRSAHEMERIKGWTREMEDSERVFKRELVAARKQLEDAAEIAVRPSRDIEYYSTYTLAHPLAGNNGTANLSPERRVTSTGERQGWLFLRTWIRKPTRVLWVKRWAFVRNGVFGWLVQGTRPGTVEESERIGVLLCSVRPMPHEERRFCFELKTTKHTIGLQAETQADLAAWLSAIDTAKAKAVNDPASSEAFTLEQSATDPAFSILAPPVLEFGTAILASTEPETAGESISLDRSSTMSSLSADSLRDGDLLRRQTAASLLPAYEEVSKDHASKIMSKLDLHRRTPTSPQISSPATPSGGGIASLIAASHGSMPVGPSVPMVQNESVSANKKSSFTLALRDMPSSSLAPSTLANAPAPTAWSKSAVIIAGERGIHGSRTNKNGVSNGILANTWGSSNGSQVHRLERVQASGSTDDRLQPSPLLRSANFSDDRDGRGLARIELTLPQAASRSRTPSPGWDRRQTFSNERELPKVKPAALPEFPATYPIQLKTQDAQFRLLFPNVHLKERLVLVFRSTWNPNGQQEFPGRVYVTADDMYFYSNHLGLVLTSSVPLSAVEEITAAPGKDCDFLFMHLREPSKSGATRITIKVFLEPLRLLQKRLNFLAQNATSNNSLPLQEIIRVLLQLETDGDDRSPSLDSWEDLSMSIPQVQSRSRSRANTTDLKAPVRVDRALWGGSGQSDSMPKFKLPAQPVKYLPPGYQNATVERHFDVSPKALFHVMFGDKSLLWQLLQHERQAKNLKQGPWTNVGEGRLYRDFEFTIPMTHFWGRQEWTEVKDYQFVDVNNDHLCYVVTDKRTPWHLPSQRRYRLISKIVITHVAKSKCKLSVFTKVEWLSNPWVLKSAIEAHAMTDLQLDAEDLMDLVADQVRKLGAHSRTKKAVSIFGFVGQSSDVTQLHINQSAIGIESRRATVQRSLVAILWQELVSFMLSLLGNVFGLLVDLVVWVRDTWNGHRIILLMLVLSALYNAWFSVRDGFEWWLDRNTTKFLNRIGVGPDLVMSRAVHVADLQGAISSNAVHPNRNASDCFQAFSMEQISMPIEMSDQGLSFRGARQQLGIHRHDLLVALRVVNSIDQDLARAEWERWLVKEHKQCLAIKPMIQELGNQNNTEVDSVEIMQWYDSYCKSCATDFSEITDL